MNVLILGGGLAGLSCAVELIDQGHDVTLLEAQPNLGGKAASWRDVDGDLVDLGQHVVTPLYQHFLRLLDKVGATGNLIWKEGEYILATAHRKTLRQQLRALQDELDEPLPF